MAKSSIHIQAGAYNFFRHNDRSQPTKNSIFDDEQNECSQPAEAAYQEWKKAVKERAAKYTERTGQKLNKKTITHLSAIVNLNAHHTIDDLQPLADYLEEEFGTKIIQTAIHRDEGHWGEDGTAEKNYHAHLEMVGLDDEGRSVRRKLTRAALSKLQTKTAKILGMERGTNYASERKPRPKRLDTYEFKVAKEREEQGRREEMAKIKDIQSENRRLREQLREAGAQRAQYAQLEAVIRDLKEQARQKDLTIEELQAKIIDLQSRIAQNEPEIADTPTPDPIGDHIAQLLAKIDDLHRAMGGEVEKTASKDELIEATRLITRMIPHLELSDELKIDKVSTLVDYSKLIYWVDKNITRDGDNPISSVLNPHDVVVSKYGTPSIKIDIERLATPGEFSRYYRWRSIDEKIDEAAGVIDSAIGKVSEKSSTPSPAAPTSSNRQDTQKRPRMKP